MLAKISLKTGSKNGGHIHRFRWKITDVSNSVFPDADIRNYYDILNIRNILKEQNVKFENACEIGCGYGRVINVLKEFSNTVTGFEREEFLVEMANKYLRDIIVKRISDLNEISNYGPFNLLMTCTVLQHIPDSYVSKLIYTMKKSCTDDGYILLVESTDDTNLKSIGDINNHNAFLSRPRNVDFYAKSMIPFKLISTSKRILEKTFDTDPGTLMLFKNSK